MMSDYDKTTDDRGCIKNGLRADVMRCCMENKNLLEENGSIYVGTGEKIIIGEGTSNRITIAKTKALNPGEYGELLMVKDGDLSYSKLSEENFSYDVDGVVEIRDSLWYTIPVAEACYSLKKDLYTVISQTFAADTTRVQVPIDTRLGYIGILNPKLDKHGVTSAGSVIDFGFFDIDFVNDTFDKITLFPKNYKEVFNYDLYLEMSDFTFRGNPATAVDFTLTVRGSAAGAFFGRHDYSSLNLKIFANQEVLT